jgi:hypothetical protein
MFDIVSDAVVRECFYLRHLKEEGCGTLYQMQKQGSSFIFLSTTSEGGKMCDIVSDAEAREYFYLFIYDIRRRKDV